MTSNTSLLTRGDRLWATSQQKEENRAPWWGYNKRSAAGWYLGHPRKGEHQSDALTFQSTTIDNNSGQELTNRSVKDLAEMVERVRSGFRRVRSENLLLRSFLDHAGVRFLRAALAQIRWKSASMPA